MLKLVATLLGTMSYFSITQPSERNLFNSVGSNSIFVVLSDVVPSVTLVEMLTTNTFFILFIIKVKIIISAVGFGSAKLTANVLQLGEVAEIAAQMFSFAQKFNRRTAVEFSTKLAILPNCCWAIVIYLFIILLCSAFNTFGFCINTLSNRINFS